MRPSPDVALMALALRSAPPWDRPVETLNVSAPVPCFRVQHIPSGVPDIDVRLATEASLAFFLGAAPTSVPEHAARPAVEIGAMQVAEAWHRACTGRDGSRYADITFPYALLAETRRVAERTGALEREGRPVPRPLADARSAAWTGRLQSIAPALRDFDAAHAACPVLAALEAPLTPPAERAALGGTALAWADALDTALLAGDVAALDGAAAFLGAPDAAPCPTAFDALGSAHVDPALGGALAERAIAHAAAARVGPAPPLVPDSDAVDAALDAARSLAGGPLRLREDGAVVAGDPSAGLPARALGRLLSHDGAPSELSPQARSALVFAARAASSRCLDAAPDAHVARVRIALQRAVSPPLAPALVRAEIGARLAGPLRAWADAPDAPASLAPLAASLERLRGHFDAECSAFASSGTLGACLALAATRLEMSSPCGGAARRALIALEASAAHAAPFAQARSGISPER